MYIIRKIDNNSIKTNAYKFDKLIALSGAAIPTGVALGNAGFEAAIVLTSILWLTRIIKFKDLEYGSLLKHPVIMPSIAIYISILISVVINGGGSKGFLHDIVMIRHLLCIMALVDTSFKFPVWKYLFYGLIVCFVYVIINMILINLIGYDVLGESFARYTSKHKEGNRYPTLLAFLTIFFISWGLLDKKLNTAKRALIIATGFTGFAFFCFFHIRTVLLAFLSGILFVMIYLMLRKQSIKLTLLFLILLVVSCAIFIQTTDMFFLNTVYDRIYVWKVSFQIWLENPIFGCGISSFIDNYSDIVKREIVKPFVAPNGKIYVDTSTRYHAHNNFLQILSCTGIIGLGVSLWLAFNIIYINFKNLAGHFLGYISWPIVYFIISFAGFSVYAGWYMALTTFIIVSICCKKHV